MSYESIQALFSISKNGKQYSIPFAGGYPESNSQTTWIKLDADNKSESENYGELAAKCMFNVWCLLHFALGKDDEDLVKKHEILVKFEKEMIARAKQLFK